MVLRLRPVTTEELTPLERRARSRTEPARRVERARVSWLAHQGRRVPAIAEELGLSQGTVRLWLKRFNAHGLAGLADRPRSGRPPTYTAEAIGAVSAAALTKPEALGLPFGSWTLDRLAT